MELAERYAHVYAAVGFHPSDADAFTEDSLDQLRQLARHPKVRAIGEIGLDYYWTDYAGHDRQKEVLRQQLALAQELDLPVIFHDREAHGDSLAVVKEFPGVRWVFHCYSGSLEDAKTLIALGWNLSFTGSITYKNAKKAPEVLTWIPEDRFMIETDAPYMLPYPRVKGRSGTTPAAPPDRRQNRRHPRPHRGGGGADQHRERHPLLRPGGRLPGTLILFCRICFSSTRKTTHDRRKL